jgi:PhoPQ-activated pathogenicity-related protein
MLIKAEVEARNTWMGQYKNTQIDLIPVLTTGFENLFNRSSLDTEQAAFIEKATLPQLEEKLELMKVFIKEHPEKVPAVLWYAANEILESGNPIVPTKRRDGTIDTSVLDTIKKHLE